MRQTLLFLLLASICAQGAMITVGGDLPLPVFGGAGPLAIGAMLNQPFANPFGVNHSVQGTVIARNFGNVFTLTLTDLTYRSDVAGPVVETIRIVQDYVMAPGIIIGFSAEHFFAGNCTFNALPQNCRVDKISAHNAVPLPPLAAAAASVAGALPQVAAVGAGPVGAAGAAPIYRIDTTFTLTLTGGAGGGNWVQVQLPGSAEDTGEIKFIPEPSSLNLLAVALAGLSLVASRRNLRAR